LNIADTQNSKAEKFITLGRAMGLVQEWDLAYFAFEQAISADEKNAEAWAWLGEAKQQLGQDGSEEIGKALNLNPSSSIIHALSGLRWMRQENFRKALDQYKLAIQSEPENPAWYASAGDAYTKLGDLYAALEMYQRVTELTPQDASVWRRLAIFCAENSIYIEEIALPAAQQALTLLPNDSANLDTLAYVYFLSGRFANAEIYFLQAIEIDSEYFPAHLHLAMNYLAQGDRTKAYNTLTYIRDARASGVYRESALRLLEKYFP
jgi:tetratricopeptide (TPR) repeat protein